MGPLPARRVRSAHLRGGPLAYTRTRLRRGDWAARVHRQRCRTDLATRGRTGPDLEHRRLAAGTDPHRRGGACRAGAVSKKDITCAGSASRQPRRCAPLRTTATRRYDGRYGSRPTRRHCLIYRRKHWSPRTLSSRAISSKRPSTSCSITRTTAGRMQFGEETERSFRASAWAAPTLSSPRSRLRDRGASRDVVPA